MSGDDWLAPCGDDRKPAIINLMPHGPAYHYAPNERPDVGWEKKDGSWVGFWKRKWPDLLGAACAFCPWRNEVLAVANQIAGKNAYQIRKLRMRAISISERSITWATL